MALKRKIKTGRNVTIASRVDLRAACYCVFTVTSSITNDVATLEPSMPSK